MQYVLLLKKERIKKKKKNRILLGLEMLPSYQPLKRFFRKKGIAQSQRSCHYTAASLCVLQLNVMAIENSEMSRKENCKRKD